MKIFLHIILMIRFFYRFPDENKSHHDFEENPRILEAVSKRTEHVFFPKNNLSAPVCRQHTTNESFLAALKGRSHRCQKALLQNSNPPAIKKNGRRVFKHLSLAATFCVSDLISATRRSSEPLCALRQTGVLIVLC